MADLDDGGKATKKGPVSGPAAYKKVITPAKPAAPFMTEHADGTMRQWGETPSKVPDTPVDKVPLHPTSNPGDIQEVDANTVAHLKKKEPRYGSLVGEPIPDANGTRRYNPDQSDNIRALLKSNPLPSNTSN